MIGQLTCRSGHTIVDLLVAMGVFGVLLSSALPHFDPRRQDINTVLATMMGDFRTTRARAITTGTHFSVAMNHPGQYQVRRHREQADAWPVDTVTNTVAPPGHVTFWMDPGTLEFNTRGMMITTVGGESLPVYVYLYDAVGSQVRAFSVWPSGQVNQEF